MFLGTWGSCIFANICVLMKCSKRGPIRHHPMSFINLAIVKCDFSSFPFVGFTIVSVCRVLLLSLNTLAFKENLAAMK